MIVAELRLSRPGGDGGRSSAGGAGIVDPVSAELPPDFFNRPLAEVDPEIAEVLALELERQQRTLEMIASENFVPAAVLECQGSVLTNKYAEGYPGKRYYGGCEYVDIAEQLAIDRAKALFGAEHANVQPHSGAQANAAVYHALLQPGDTLMGLELAHGGHLTHGMKINVSGRLYDIVAYQVDRETSLIDMDEVRAGRPGAPAEDDPRRLVGLSAPARLRRASGRSPTRSARYLMVDMAHFAGLVAAGLHPQPGAVRRRGHDDDPQDDRRRPRRDDPVHARSTPRRSTRPCSPASRAARSSTSSPARRWRCGSRQSEAFRERQERTLAGARAVAEELLGAGGGVNVLTGGTDVHLVLCDLRESELDGQQAEDRLHDDRDHRQPQRGPVRPAAAGGLLRAADRHAGAGDPGLRARRLRRGRAGSSPRRSSPGTFDDRRGGARRAGRRDRRALPAVRGARRRRASPELAARLPSGAGAGPIHRG